MAKNWNSYLQLLVRYNNGVRNVCSRGNGKQSDFHLFIFVFIHQGSYVFCQYKWKRVTRLFEEVESKTRR